jgi:hypothetical protein
VKVSRALMTWSLSTVLSAAALLALNGGLENVAHANGNAAAALQCINTCNQQWSQCEQNCNGDFDCSTHCDTAKGNCISYCQTL